MKPVTKENFRFPIYLGMALLLPFPGLLDFSTGVLNLHHSPYGWVVFLLGISSLCLLIIAEEKKETQKIILVVAFIAAILAMSAPLICNIPVQKP